MAGEARWLDRDAAAEYLCLRVDELPRLVRAGKLPAPDLALGPRRPRWDRLALDAVFSGGVASTDPRQAVAALASDILSASRRPRRPGQTR